MRVMSRLAFRWCVQLCVRRSRKKGLCTRLSAARLSTRDEVAQRLSLHPPKRWLASSVSFRNSTETPLAEAWHSNEISS